MNTPDTTLTLDRPPAEAPHHTKIPPEAESKAKAKAKAETEAEANAKANAETEGDSTTEKMSTALDPTHLAHPKGHSRKWKEAEEALAKADPQMANLIARVGACALQPDRREPYEALVRAIAFQQLTTKAADSILARFHAIYGNYFPPPLMLMLTPEELLRSIGFSKGKIAAIQGIARAAHDGSLPTLAACRKLDNEQIINRLIPLRGVGRWTAEMFLIFTLGREDVWPVDDFGIREGYRVLHGLNEQPTPAEMARHGATYAPWRSVASWYLWRGLELFRKQG